MEIREQLARPIPMTLTAQHEKEISLRHIVSKTGFYTSLCVCVACVVNFVMCILKLVSLIKCGLANQMKQSLLRELVCLCVKKRIRMRIKMSRCILKSNSIFHIF